MKNLVNCTPEEFLTQTYKMMDVASRWVKAVDITGIRKELPELLPVPADKEEARLVIDENARRMKEQGLKNLMKMYGRMANEQKADTLMLLALACFVPPEEINDHHMGEYLVNISEMLADEATISFFILLAKLNGVNTLK